MDVQRLRREWHLSTQRVSGGDEMNCKHCNGGGCTACAFTGEIATTQDTGWCEINRYDVAKFVKENAITTPPTDPAPVVGTKGACRICMGPIVFVNGGVWEHWYPDMGHKAELAELVNDPAPVSAWTEE